MYNDFNMADLLASDQKKPESVVKENVTIQPQPTVRFEPEKELFGWKAASRPFKKKDRDFWVRLVTIAGVFAVILFLIEGTMPVVLMISLLFLFYVLSTVEPEEIEYKITNKGIKIADKRIDWDLLTRFWFTKRGESELLVVGTLGLSGRLELIINESDKDKIRKTLLNFLPEEEMAPTNMDKMSGWLTSKLSGN